MHGGQRSAVQHIRGNTTLALNCSEHNPFLPRAAAQTIAEQLLELLHERSHDPSMNKTLKKSMNTMNRRRT